ncbi:hypothetical protein Q8A73_002800 [Channa argus]|nr:hypothetical protein Q8A73_002800 [Channa argus]
MVSQFRHEAKLKRSSSSEQQVVKPGEVPCDVCTGTKLKALKSCLVCLVSFCETHLEPHLTASGLKRHQLMDPVKNLEDRMCREHDKPLELFCKTDHTCVCMLCSVLDHKTHEFVPLKEEYEGKKAELEKTEAEIQQMIQKRRLKIQEIKRSVSISKEGADRETAEGVQVFTALKESVERGLNQLIKEIEDKHKTTEKQAENFIKELEQEISDLMKRSSEVEQLSRSEDHLHLLQSFQSLEAAPPTKNWTQVKGKMKWDLGVARESINRKGEITLSPQNGFWTIWLRKGNEYEALDDPPIRLYLKSQPEKVGVFVDYEEGLVSFYDVDAAALIYSFTGCSFTEKLYPFLSPCNSNLGKNSVPLIICPVSQTS